MGGDMEVGVRSFPPNIALPRMYGRHKSRAGHTQQTRPKPDRTTKYNKHVIFFGLLQFFRLSNTTR